MAFSLGAFKSIAIASASPLVPKVVEQLSSVFGLHTTLPGGPSSYAWKTTAVEITIYDSKNDKYFKIPVIPEKVEYTDGSPIVDGVKVLNLGNVEFHNGVDLDGLNWDSFFPGRYDASYCTTPKMLTPTDYKNMFSTWKDEGVTLQLIIPAFAINKAMRVNTFTWTGSGFEGDITYSVAFREYKKIIPKQIEIGGVLPARGQKTAEERPAAPAEAEPTPIVEEAPAEGE